MTQRQRMLRRARRMVARYRDHMDETLRAGHRDVATYAAVIALWDGANSVYKSLSKSKR